MSKNDDYAYVKFYGPLVEDGKIDLGQAGKTLISLNRWFKAYKKELLKTEENIVLRAGGIRKGSSEIQIFLEFLQTGYGQAATVAVVAGSAFKNLGVREFFQKFMGTLGEQLALKLFAKGGSLKEKNAFIDDGVEKVEVINERGAKKVIPKEDWIVYSKTNRALIGFCNLEKGREEKMKVGYYDSHTHKMIDVSELTYADRDFFQDINDPDEWARRLSEPFDETKAEEVKIIGQFIDFYGMATKYHFSFQARREQEKYGKQKVLCIVDENETSKILDLLKPDNRKNVCVKGMATKDRESRIDKIKIEWINEDPTFNPNQTSII